MANKYAVETAFRLIDQTTGTLNKIGVKGNAVGKQLKKDFMKAQDQLASLGKVAVKAGAAIAAAGAAAVGAWAAKGIKDAIEYDAALRKVSTVADTTTVSMEQLSRGLMNISNDTGTAVAELAELQYSAIVSGIKTADSVSFVETAVKTATATFTESATVIDGLTAVLNAYGMEASQASTIAGQMLITNNLGKTSFEELNGALGKVLPTAARLNVGTDELFASLTALTANSIETPKAVKGLQRILEAIQKPTDSVAKAAQRLGIDFSVAALRSKGFAGFLKEIQEKTGGSEEAILSLFGSVESLNAITVLTGKGAGQFSEALGAMQNATETLDSAFQTIDASPAERWGDIINIIKNAGINLGTKLLPVIEKVTEKIEKVVGDLMDYDFTPVAEKIGSVFDTILKFGEYFLNLAGIIWKLRGPIIAVAGAVALYRGGMLLAAGAINGFTAAQNIAKGVQLSAYLITGNQTKAMALYKAGTMGATAQTALFWVRQKAVQMSNFAGTIIKQGAAFIALKAQLIAAKVATIAFSVAQKAAAIATGIMNGAMTVTNALFVASPIGWIVLAIGALIAVIILCVKNWDKIIAALQKAWDWIKNVASMIWDNLNKAFQSLTGFIQQNSEKALAFIAIFTGPFGFIISIVKELKDNWGAIVEAFKTDGIIAGFNKLGGVIFSAVLAPIQGILEMLSLIPLIGEKIAPAAEKIKDFRSQLKGIEAETTIVQNVAPAQVQTIPATAATQTANATAAMPAAIPAYGRLTNVTRTTGASTGSPVAPMTMAEQHIYSQTTNRDEVEIGVRAESGTSARTIRRPQSPNVTLNVSGGNRGR
jgi:TP901 family phage tail tape measure protein